VIAQETIINSLKHQFENKNRNLMITPNAKGDKVTPGLLNLLRLGENEEILFHKKLTLSYQQLKNGERTVRKHLVVTTANVILLDYYFFHIHFPKNWREKDIVPLSRIIAVEGKMKMFMKDICPFLIIKTVSNDVYEIVFSTLGNYIADIKIIASIIKNSNANAEISIELSQTPLNKLATRFGWS